MQWEAIRGAGADDESKEAAFRQHWSLKEVQVPASTHLLRQSCYYLQPVLCALHGMLEEILHMSDEHSSLSELAMLLWGATACFPSPVGPCEGARRRHCL